MAACRKCKVSDKIEEGAGETTAELEFVEANEVGRGLGGSIFGIISTAISAISQASFLSGYTPTVVPYPWTGDVIDTAQRMATVNATVSEQALPPDAPTPLWRKVQYAREVARDDGLAALAPNVDKTMTDGFWIVTNTVQDPKPRYEIFRRVANTAVSKLVLPSGPAHTSEQAVLSRQRILAGIGMAEAALGRRYSTLDEGLATMDAVLAVLEDEAKAAYAVCDNTLFMEIRKYSIEFAKMMNDLSYRLPGKIWVNFSGGVHPLVAAYAIYKDAKRHRDLEPRNVIDANGRIGPIVSGLSP